MSASGIQQRPDGTFHRSYATTVDAPWADLVRRYTTYLSTEDEYRRNEIVSDQGTHDERFMMIRSYLNPKLIPDFLTPFLWLANQLCTATSVLVHYGPRQMLVKTANETMTSVVTIKDSVLFEHDPDGDRDGRPRTIVVCELDIDCSQLPQFLQVTCAEYADDAISSYRQQLLEKLRHDPPAPRVDTGTAGNDQDIVELFE